jgi:hypothetical protein
MSCKELMSYRYLDSDIDMLAVNAFAELADTKRLEEGLEE